jgi:tripartite-type tricarboxylate transporter receptor subunit TctC
MTLLHRHVWQMAAAFAVLTAGSPAASAQTNPARLDAWPNRPITLVHGFAAGGSTDIIARIVADGLTRRLGQQVVVEARTGAGSTTATGQVARAAPDGYTLILLTGSNPIAAAMYRDLPYKTVDDFSTIGMVVEYPYLLVTYPDHRIRTIADLLASARSANRPILYGTAGTGTGPHLAMEYLGTKAKIQLQHIPYRGGAPAATDLIGKLIDVVLDPPTNLLEFVREGRLRALAVTSGKRFFSLPDVPAIAEAGISGFDVTSLVGIAAPAGVPASIVARLNAEITTVIAEPAVEERIRALGVEPKASSQNQLKVRIVDEIAKWTSVVATAKIERF